MWTNKLSNVQYRIPSSLRAVEIQLCQLSGQYAYNAVSYWLCLQGNAGTPAYMAPELWEPGRPFSSKVDVYAFGVMLNEMLSRSPPWPGAAATDIKRQVGWYSVNKSTW